MRDLSVEFGVPIRVSVFGNMLTYTNNLSNNESKTFVPKTSSKPHLDLWRNFVDFIISLSVIGNDGIIVTHVHFEGARRFQCKRNHTFHVFQLKQFHWKNECIFELFAGAHEYCS